MISSIRLDGSTACMTIDGATDTEVFQTYVREFLCPALRPGDVVVMDNLGPHKNQETLNLIPKPQPKFFSCQPTRRTSIRLKRGGAKSKTSYGASKPEPRPL
jgi:hypothetical protein